VQHSSLSSNDGGGRVGNSRNAGKARFTSKGAGGHQTSRTNVGGGEIEGSQYGSKTNTILSHADAGMPRPFRSVNSINPSPQNVERLFYEACTKVKEGFVMKKFAFECPEYL